jgi:fluoride exporter
MIKNLFLVAIGGAFGSTLRYLIHWFAHKKNTTSFPIQTLLVNVLGCLLIGILIGYFAKHQNENEALKLLFVTGFCGGFTTFSAFGLENMTLLQNQNYQTAFLYITLSLILGILAVGIGIFITK